jgi:hypothetical protein
MMLPMLNTGLWPYMSLSLPDSKSVHAVARDPEEATHCNWPEGMLRAVVSFRHVLQLVRSKRLNDSLEVCTDVGDGDRTPNAGGDLHES